MPYKDRNSYNEYMRRYYQNRKRGGTNSRDTLGSMRDEIDKLKQENEDLKKDLILQRQGDFSKYERPIKDTDDENDNDYDSDGEEVGEIEVEPEPQTIKRNLDNIFDNIRLYCSSNDIDYETKQREYVDMVNPCLEDVLNTNYLNDDEEYVLCRFIKQKTISLWVEDYYFNLDDFMKPVDETDDESDDDTDEDTDDEDN
jgi:hypothetical protein